MLRFSQVLTLFSLLFFATSCQLFFEPMPKSWQWGMKPRPTTGMRNFPPADTEYGKGFRDGCTSAWDVVTTGLTSDLQAKFDYKRMLNSSDYNTGWFDGYEQCTYIVDWNVT